LNNIFGKDRKNTKKTKVTGSNRSVYVVNAQKINSANNKVIH